MALLPIVLSLAFDVAAHASSWNATQAENPGRERNPGQPMAFDVAAHASSWNDTDCHEPTQSGCSTCCQMNLTDPSSGALTWAKMGWSGSCDGCVEPGSPACANCFPGVRPWYNDQQFAAPGTPVPEDCKTCSPCTIREMDDFRNSHFPKPQDCTCPPDPDPPTGDCAAEKPGVMGCDCWCQDAAQMSALCGLDPEQMPGPCKIDRMVNESKNLEFKGQCDPDGYYSVVACGDTAPPKLPPSPPPMAAATQSARRGLQPGHPGWCWCVEPSYGIQNGTTAVKHPDGAPPPRMDCSGTVQCDLLNEKACAVQGALYCNWTLIPFSGGYYCANTKVL